MSDAPKSATGQAPGSSSQPRPTAAAAAKPAGDPRDAELDSLRRILAEKDQDIAAAGQRIKELEENSVTPAELSDVKAQMAELRAQIRPTAAAAPAPEPAGWEGALKAEGFVDRPEAATTGTVNPLPEGHLYRLTTIGRFPDDHPRAGELSFNGVVCVHVGKKGLRPNAPDEAERQACIKFDNGIGITDDKEVAWAMANEYGYGLDIETRPVIKYEAVAEAFEPILKPRVGPTGAKLSEKERLIAAR